MPEFVIVNGEPREVPAEVVADSRDAVAAWHAQQLKSAPSASARKPARPAEE